MLKKFVQSNPIVVVMSGPSGVGKDATLEKIKEKGVGFHYVVTATTRDQRPGEINGRDYYFLTTSEFQKKIKRNEFLEYAEVYGNYYGVLINEVQEALNKGQDVILKVDVQGSLTLKRKIPDAVFIFLLPSSIDDLVRRLKKRNSDSQEALKRRVNEAEEEIKSISAFDYAVVNYEDDLDRTAETVRSIVVAERCRVKQRKINI